MNTRETQISVMPESMLTVGSTSNMFLSACT